MRKHSNIKSKYIATGATTFCLAFTVSYIASAGFMSPSDSDASTSVNASISSDGYYINVTSLGEVNIDVDATQDSATASGTDTVTVNTNTKGYKLYLGTTSTSTNSNRMYLNGDNSSIYYLSPTTPSTSGISGLTTNSWGYSKDNGSTYSPVPLKGSEEELVNKWNTLTAGTDTTNTHTVTYGVKADMALPAGKYSSTVTYSVIAEANSVSNVASIYPSTVDYASSGTFTLSVTIPMLTNMDYGDWSVKVGSYNCSDIETSKNNNKLMLTCEVPKSLGGTNTITATSPRYGTYTAVDALKYLNDTRTIFDITNMQDMNSDICANTKTPLASATSFDTTGSYKASSSYVPQTILTDTRNSKKYVIQKMPDGRCWMVQNLYISGITLTPDKTNISSSYYLPNVAYASDYKDDVNSGSHTDGSVSSIGSSYSNKTALGGLTSGVVGSHATQDICPKNWNLPTGGTSGEFSVLYNKYSNKASFDRQWHPVYNGYYSHGPHYEDGTTAYWHSRTFSSSDYTYGFKETTTGTVDFSSSGSSIRCIAK